MTTGNVHADPTVLVEHLTACIDRFAAAWQARLDAPPVEPPDLAEFLPTETALFRRMALVELVKVDLDRRWRHTNRRMALEGYAAKFPELLDDGRMPGDLIYEEFRLRAVHGDRVEPEEYFARFPDQQDEIRALLANMNTEHTTSLSAVSRAVEYKAGDVIDDFLLIAQLGRGAFGSVFQARQQSLGRMVALKITADTGFESHTLAQLDHPNIVRVFDQRQLPPQLRLMYMQYIGGGTLRDVVDWVRKTPVELRCGALLLETIDEQLKARGESPPTDSRTRRYLARLSWPEAVCWLGARLAAALDHAHGQGVLHRDLKPANVLLAADGSPKLADFNISSCELVPGATAGAFFGGSLAYMSPEQLEVFLGHGATAASLDARSDLFSLGILLWELLTGERPFIDEINGELTSRSLREMSSRRWQGLTEAALAKLPPNCPAGMVEVLRACLESSPPRRMASAAQLQREFDLCLKADVRSLLRPSGQGVLAWMRRHPWPVLVMAGLLPNVAASALNISYNYREILRHLPHDAAVAVFQKQLLTINTVAYTLGVGLIIALCLPVIEAARRRANRRDLKGGPLLRWRLRSLMLGDYVAVLTVVEWSVSGVVFPTWFRMALGNETGIDSSHFIHFIASQLVCGMLAATWSFFLVTWYLIVVVTPTLLENERDDETMWQALARLSWRNSVYARLSLAVVPAAVIVVPLVHTESRGVFIGLGLVGLFAAALGYALARQIQQAISSLQTAVSVEDLPTDGTVTRSR